MKRKQLRLLIGTATVLAGASIACPQSVQALEAGADYYYTTDGSTPSPINGVKLTGDTINIDAPDTDTASTVEVKMVGVKDGCLDSEVATTQINFEAKDAEGGTVTGIQAPTVTLTKTQTINGDQNVLALVSGRVEGYKYYYTLDGSDPSDVNGTELTSSYIQMTAPETTEAKTVILNIVAIKDGKKSSIQTGSVSYGSKADNQVHISLRDRTYQEIGTANITKGGSAEAQAQALIDEGKLNVPGYTFLGWSESLSSVNTNLTVRAEYEKDVTATATPAEKASYNIINNGTSGDSYVQVGGATPGSTVTVYLSATDDNPNFTSKVDNSGECTVTIPKGNLNDDDGQVYVDIKEPATSAFTSDISMSCNTSSTSTPRVAIKYPSRAVSQAYSLNILTSRLKMLNSTTLEVRGILNGEIVKVYDKNNILIGKATQSNSSVPLNIALKKDMSDETIYVSRTSKGLLESQQTELNKAVIQEQLVVTNQTVENAKLLIETAVNSMDVTNKTTEQEVKTIVDSSIINSHISGTISGFEVTPADQDNDGVLKCVIDLVDSDTADNASIHVGKVIHKLSTHQTQAQAKEVIDDNIANLDISNKLTKDEVLASIKTGITDSSIKVTIPTFNLNPATTTAPGSLDMQIIISQTGHSDLAVDITGKVIPQLKGQTQTDEQLVSVINNKLKSVDAYNNLTKEIILNEVNDLITDADVTASISELIKVPATVESQGSIKGSITLTRTSTGSKIEIPVDLIVSKLVNVNQTEAQLVEAVKNKVKSLTITNNTTKDTIENELMKEVTNTELTIDISDFKLNPANTTTTGSAVWVTTITDTETGHKTVLEYIKEIIKLIFDGDSDNTENAGGDTTKEDETKNDKSTDNSETISEEWYKVGDITTEAAVRLDRAADKVDDSIDDYQATNSTSKTYLKNKLREAVNDSKIEVSISDLKLKESTRNKVGSLVFTVKLKDVTGAVITNKYELTVKKITSSGSSSSGSSSSGRSSSGGSSSESVNVTTSSNAESLGAANIVGSNGEKKGNTVKYQNSDGSCTEVLPITRDGNYSGSIIHSGTSSQGGSIKIPEGTNDIKHLYKYVSTLGKFIEIPNALVVSQNTLTFKQEANATYYVSINALDGNVILQQGWNSINSNSYFVEGFDLKKGWLLDNGSWKYLDPIYGNKVTGWKLINSKWYLMSTEGNMLTGWVLDSGVWYYLKPANGDMVQGWKELGSTWYHMNQNGSMSTGWKKIDGKWYYFDADGSMTHSTTVDGYQIGEDGAML